MTGKDLIEPPSTDKSHDAFKAEALAKPEELDALLDACNPVERERVSELAQRASRRAAGPDMRLSMNKGILEIAYAHKNPDAAALLLMADLGTCDPAFQAGITIQVASIGRHGQAVDDVSSNFLLSVVRAVEPRDELESMLAVQMGAIHAATMMMARRLNHVETIPQQDAAERALNKLARTYAMQMEALKRYRTGGQQRVLVEHVTVNAGGQAIVGSVTHGGRGSNEA
ncbi:MAG: hypothetical protein V4747_07555 [Pseudomonadota bacterium]